MRLPFFATSEYSYFENFNNPQEIFAHLTSRPIEHAVTFFQIAADDETWVKETGGELMHLLIRWFNQQFLARKLSLHHVENIASNFQQHYLALINQQEFDIKFWIEGRILPASSLMFGASSEILRELIWKHVEEKSSKIELKMSGSTFEFFQEFVYTGTIDNLWKEDSEVIFDLLRESTAWQMTSLARLMLHPTSRDT